MGRFPSDTYRRGAANRDPEEEALGWVVRLTSGDVTDGDRREFAEWHEASENALAFERAERLWDSLGPILEREVTELSALPAPDPPRTLDRRPHLKHYLGIAASLLVAATTSFQYFHNWRYDYVNGLTTAVPVSLADGSHVMMAPGAAFNADFSHGERRITLARGEAYFDVRHDADHPFTLSAGTGLVRDLGTAFAVRKDRDGEITVTVSRGRVEVSDATGRAVLTPDRQIRFDEHMLGQMRAVDASLAMAWTRGRLIMEDRPLANVLAELDLYHDGKIVLLNEAAGRRHINAVIDLGRTDSWLTALAASQRLRVTSIGPLTILW